MKINLKEILIMFWDGPKVDYCALYRFNLLWGSSQTL